MDIRKILFMLFALFSVCSPAKAQNKKLKFHSINSVGMVSGESPVNATLQNINGIVFSNWYLGIGSGVDYYHYKTLPLFIDGRRYFGKEKKGFLYADLGYDFPMKNRPGKEIGYYNTYHFKGDLYTDFGIGYKTKFIKKSSLLFSLGYSYKQLQSKIEIRADCFGCQPLYYNYKFGYGRIILKTGVEF